MMCYITFLYLLYIDGKLWQASDTWMFYELSKFIIYLLMVSEKDPDLYLLEYGYKFDIPSCIKYVS